MLHEWTDSAASRAFKRTARLAAVIVALAGLTACGGGGGSSTPSTPTPTPTPAPTPTPTPEIPITPAAPLPGGGSIEEAAELPVGQTIEGSLESADAVKYYSLDLDERSTVEFTLDAEEGIEMVILDEHGNVITSGVTSSLIRKVLNLARGKYIIRIRDAHKKAVDRTFRFLAKHSIDPVSLLGSVIRLARGIPHVRVTIAGDTYEFDARDHLQTPDGREISFRLAASRGGVRVALEGTTARFQATEGATPGDLDFTLTACEPDTGICRTEVVRVTVDRATRGLRVKPEFSTSGGSFTLAAGESHQVTFLRNFFEYEAEPGQAESPAWWRERRLWRYSTVPPAPHIGWSAEIVGTSPDELLRVTAPASTNTQAAETITVEVTVTKTVTALVRETATVRFTFSLEEEEPPPSPGDGVSYVCPLRDTATEMCSSTIRGGDNSDWWNATLSTWRSNGEIRIDSTFLRTVPGVSREQNCGYFIVAVMNSIAEIQKNCGGFGTQCDSRARNNFAVSVCDLDSHLGGWRIPGLGE